jgi:SAM-dependent methyltransferase
MKELLLRLLAWTGLLRPSYRAYERLQAVRARGRPEPAGDLPLPPAWLRVRVAGTADPEWFVASGEQSVAAMGAALAAADAALDDLDTILDFGCGCGRVLRHLAGVPADVYGTDPDGPAIRWCRANLGFAQFHQNGAEAFLPYPAGKFDFVYALSVLTHLRLDQQRDWMAELARVLKPRSLLLLTTHGRRYLDRLSEGERASFEAGEIVVRHAGAAGTNLCTTFHPPERVRDEIAQGFTMLHEALADPLGPRAQDLFLLRVAEESARPRDSSPPEGGAGATILGAR